MGWTDSHLHAFRIGRTSYGIPDPEFPDDVVNERNVRLDKVAGADETLIYEYDFGDGWEHELKVEKVLTPEPGMRYPRCTAGKRACPPEDCGGPPGYEHLNEVSDQAGISRATPTRIANVPGYNTNTDTINSLCRYFDCTLNDLLVYIPDDGKGKKKGRAH